MYSPESQENIFVKYESLSPSAHSSASIGSAVSTEEIKDGVNNMDTKRYALRWRHHQSTVVAEVGSLFRESALVDVTLACEDQKTYQAHKLVLSACSQYFQALFAKHPAHQHPIIFLKDVDGDECEALLTFMYRGEVSVNQDQIPRILRVASSLQVRGLAEVETQHASRPHTPVNSADRVMKSPSPVSPVSVSHPPPKSGTPVSQPTSPAPHSLITSHQEQERCSLPQQTSAASQNLPRPPPSSQEYPSPLGYLMRPPFDLSPGGPPVPLQIPPSEQHERKRSEEKAQMPAYNSPQLRVKSDLGGNWEGNMDIGPLSSHPIREGQRHPYLHHPLFSSFMNLEQAAPAGSPGYGVNNPPFSIRDPLNRLSGNETRIHKCDFCARKFKRKDHLKTHVRIHTGERPYKCKICGRGFIQSQQVKIHMKVHSREDTSSLSASSVMGGSAAVGGMSALSSLYSELSSHYEVHQNDRLIRSSGSHSNTNYDQSPDQLLGPQTDEDSDNEVSSDMPDNDGKSHLTDVKNIDPGPSRIFPHRQNLLKNQDHSPSPERSPSGEIPRHNDLDQRHNDVDSRLSDNDHGRRISPARYVSYPHHPPVDDSNNLKEARAGYPLLSNIKK